MDSAALDDIINRLLEVKGRPGKQVQLSESEIRRLCLQSKEIFMHQPNLLDLEAPIKICGNIFFKVGFFFSWEMFVLLFIEFIRVLVSICVFMRGLPSVIICREYILLFDFLFRLKVF